MTMLPQQFTKDGLPSLKPYLDVLLKNGYVEEKEVKWGKGYRNVIINNENSKKYQYKKASIEINNNLKKVIVSLYIIHEKSLNEKMINNNKINVDLKFDNDGDRTWVNKDTFLEIQTEHDNLQDSGTLNDPWGVEFRIAVHLKHVDTQKTYTKQAFPPMTMVYGGNKGVLLFLKQKVIETVYRYEDSEYEIISIDFKQLYIQKRNQTNNVKFSKIKMYGTVFNYKGFMLEAMKTENPNCCVPEYIHDLLNNQFETDG